MRKRDELVSGCMAKAHDDEMTFVLLGRDAAAPMAIRAWISERIRLGKNQPNDVQLVEAEECAQIMEAEWSAPPPPPDSPARQVARAIWEQTIGKKYGLAADAAKEAD